MNDIDWQLLLEKYMTIIMGEESISYLHCTMADYSGIAPISEEEEQALLDIEKKAEARLAAARGVLKE